MRKIRNQQLPLAEATTDHPKAEEFAQSRTTQTIGLKKR